MNTCTNCGQQFTDKYCNHCGMKKNDGHIYFKDQWHDAMYYLFSLDSPLWRTFKGLMTNPGRVGNEYIAGKRKSYYTPIKYFILGSAIYFLLVKLTGYNPVKMQYEAFGSQGPQNPVADAIRNNVNYFLFLLIFILSLFMKLFFRKQRKTYPENLSFSFFIVGHFLMLNIIFVPLSFISPKFSIIKYSLLIYMMWGIYSFYTGSAFWRGIKSFLTVFLSYLIYIVIVFFMVLFYYKITNPDVIPH